LCEIDTASTTIHMQNFKRTVAVAGH